MSKSTVMLVTGVIMAMTAAPALASEISGTLTGGGSSTNTSGNNLSGTVSSGNNLTGTVSSGNNLTGTVVAPTTSGSTGGGGGGSTGGGSNGPPVSGGGGGGSGSVIIDICPNLPGIQPTLPAGFVLVNGQCVQNTGAIQTLPPTGQVLGASTSNFPQIPNTGAGGDAMVTLTVLLLSALSFFSGVYRLVRR